MKNQKRRRKPQPRVKRLSKKQLETLVGGISGEECVLVKSCCFRNTNDISRHSTITAD